MNGSTKLTGKPGSGPKRDTYAPLNADDTVHRRRLSALPDALSRDIHAAPQRRADELSMGP